MVHFVTWGKSKLMPLMEAFLEMIILKHFPVPPPTSTNDISPLNPWYTSRIFFMIIVERSAIPLLNTSLKVGSMSIYWNMGIPCTFLNWFPPSRMASFTCTLERKNKINNRSWYKNRIPIFFFFFDNHKQYYFDLSL